MRNMPRAPVLKPIPSRCYKAFDSKAAFVLL
jgi:hypothetical protein